MKIVLIYDTHTKHYELNDMSEYSDCQMIIHAGDISSKGRSYEVNDFYDWYSGLSFEYKIFIPGNHDFNFENTDNLPNHIQNIRNNIPKGITYLNNDSIEIEGIKIYGSPVTVMKRIGYYRNYKV